MQQAKEDPKEIVQKAIDLMNGISSKSEATMTVTRPKWSRTISMKTWSLGNEYFMILITDPPEDKGQSFLKRKDEMWNWVPSISRIIRIPPSMMGQNWMGSDFTNNDLAERNSVVDDYQHTLLGHDTIQGFDCHKIKLIPNEDAAVIWGKVILWISAEYYFLLKAEYYNEDGELVNRETQTDIKQFGDRKLPAKLTMTPVKEKGKETVLVFNSIQFDVGLDETFFSQQNMKSLN